MYKNIMDITSTLPVISPSYNTLDIVGKTFGRYFDYKKETALIRHETEKVKQQTIVLCKHIDAELQKSLDSNDKNLQKEMFRLKTIAKSLKNDAKTSKEIMKNISLYIQMLSNETVPMSIKEKIPNLIEISNKLLIKESEQSFLKLNSMAHFNPDIKQIKG